MVAGENYVDEEIIYEGLCKEKGECFCGAS